MSSSSTDGDPKGHEARIMALRNEIEEHKEEIRDLNACWWGKWWNQNTVVALHNRIAALGNQIAATQNALNLLCEQQGVKTFYDVSLYGPI
jgi:uncharacterized small protein (DUF1192 family)